MKFERIKPGMTLYDVHSTKMGNTTMRSVGCWEVRIISVDDLHRTAQVSWNGNRPQTYFRRQLEKLRVNEPVIIRSEMGRGRLATRDELRAMKKPETA